MNSSEIGFEPFGDRVVVRMDRAETMSKGGLHLPGREKETLHRGVIVATNDKHLDMLGAHVVYGKYSGDVLELDGERYIVIDIDKLWGRLGP